ncbi:MULTISPECIES: response regulator transcription factor [unclassified Rhizobium]|uniref:response regulator transcription factor n=1 Tax=unclassified Rhizobium TaxID=2613769 RepID=UPI001C840136|nr:MULTISPECIES: response regulator transcription factor [unclassified Rhizobium]MBX5166846.1 response regulator transcription factor [Rhizobium sp. NZLR4b]MBX5186384.1 response regulator transcription factor [Rhizobium sp. NZLR5]
MKILLVEDDPEMAEALRTALSRHDFVLAAVADLAMAREAIAVERYDVVLIDRQLPDGDGSALLAEIRRTDNPPRSIIISAMGSTKDRIAGLNGGADDYLPKPFEVDELIARLNAVARRTPEAKADIITIGNIRYDRVTRDLYVNGIRQELARRELLIIESLLKNLGRTVLRSSLEESVYSFDDEIQSNSLEANMSRLRRKLADAGADIVIRNIRGVGYFLHEQK